MGGRECMDFIHFYSKEHLQIRLVFMLVSERVSRFLLTSHATSRDVEVEARADSQPNEYLNSRVAVLMIPS